MRAIAIFTGLLALVTLSCGDDKDDFTCNTNSKVESFGKNKCFRGTAMFTEGKDGAGNLSETFKLNFSDPNGGSGADVHVSSVPYQPPFTSIGKLQTGTAYTVSNNHANMYIDNIIKLVSGSVTFSNFDRTNRTVSGSAEFTYTINNSSGNQDTTFKVEFSDVKY